MFNPSTRLHQTANSPTTGDVGEGVCWQPVLPPSSLLDPFKQVCEQAYELSGITPRLFNSYYQPVLDQLADYVQQISLEGELILARRLTVVVTALRQRQAYLLPLGASPARIS